ncbi:uncharacterized protein TNCV_4141721 [Trichonephila clavipes]|nr:uncharacterized protein TNCV_4141721 [Trichonephila clavipes]
MVFYPRDVQWLSSSVSRFHVTRPEFKSRAGQRRLSLSPLSGLINEYQPCLETEHWRCCIVRVQYFVRGGFVGHRSRASSKHLSSHLPVDGVRFLGGQKGVALQLQDARVGVGSNKDADHSRCSEK